MRRLIPMAVLLAAVAQAGRADDKSDAAKKLEGTYEVVSATRAGKAEPKAGDIKSFVIKGDLITIDAKDKDMKAKFKLDPAKKPAEIDIMPQEGGKDFTLKGVYETKDTDKGLELTIVFGGPDAARPKDLKGEGDVMVLKLLRKK